jgi:hypothetical protein
MSQHQILQDKHVYPCDSQLSLQHLTIDLVRSREQLSAVNQMQCMFEILPLTVRSFNSLGN